MAFRIKRSANRGIIQSVFTDETKINAIAEHDVDGLPVSQVIERVYTTMGRKVPKKPSIILGQWKMSLNKRLLAGDSILLKKIQDACPDLLEEYNPSKEAVAVA